MEKSLCIRDTVEDLCWMPRGLWYLRRHCITHRHDYVIDITKWAQEYFQKPLSVNKIHCVSNSAEKLDATESMDSLFSSTLDMVNPLCLRKIKEKSPTWYNEQSHTLKRAARKMEHI